MIRWILVISILHLYTTAYSQVFTGISLSKDTVQVGEQLGVTVTLKSSQQTPIRSIDFSPMMKPEVLYNAMSPPDSLGNMELPEMDIIESVEKPTYDWVANEDGKGYTLTYNLKFAFWDPGAYKFNFPAINLKSRSHRIKRLEVPPIIVDLPDGLESEQVELRPIKTIIKEGKHWTDYLYIIWSLGALLAAGILYYLIKRFNKIEDIVVEKVEIKRKPFEIALEQLDHLEKEALWQSGQIKEYQSKLTHVIREYLENQYDIKALESTTHEIKKALTQTKFDRKYEVTLTEILQIADLVKFAKAKPSSDIHSRFLQDAKNFVHDTKSDQFITSEEEE